jgi:thiol-disulfide isomerase/thioredoxin
MRTRVLIPALLAGFVGLAAGAADDRKAAPGGPNVHVPKLPDGVTPEKLGDPQEAERVAAWLEKEYPEPRPESVRMLVAILRGSQLMGNDGWFGPAETRYTWKWLADRNGAADAKEIPKDQFRGPAAHFARLDRDGDGRITAGDLDWSDRNPYVMQANMINRIFRRIENGGDGKLTREELDAFFKYVAGDKDHATAEDFRRALLPRGGGFAPGDGPSVPVLVRGLFAQEIGSLGEGPKVGDPAPDFTLKTPDGEGGVTLSKLTGKRPVVLCFGNFTCGPFRGLYPEVDAVYRKYKDEADFLMVYVREAHPTDGWKMDSNAKAGVSFKQPTTYGERVEVCEAFRKKLTPGMPVVVDDINDPAGTAYSGMPARLYVIDATGRVAYKSGRGPFGFKPQEMEQALAMALLERAPGAP